MTLACISASLDGVTVSVPTIECPVYYTSAQVCSGEIFQTAAVCTIYERPCLKLQSVIPASCLNLLGYFIDAGGGVRWRVGL